MVGRKTPPSKNIEDFRWTGSLGEDFSRAQRKDEHNVASEKIRNRTIRQNDKADRRAYKETVGAVIDATYDDNKRGEPGAHRRRIHAPAWYEKERFGEARPDSVRVLKRKPKSYWKGDE